MENRKSAAPLSDEHVRQRHLDRLVMMSDGVFAIAMTLSAVELRPEMTPGQSLFDAWAMPLGIYFLSFLIIASVWFLQRRSLAHLRDADNATTWLNLVLLSLVALMPVVIRFVLTSPAGEADAGTVVYALAMAATYGCLALGWGYSALYAGLAPDVARRQAWDWLSEYLLVTLVFGGLAFYGLHLRALAASIIMAGVAMRLVALRLGRAGKS